MGTITCAKCGLEKEAFTEKPMFGSYAPVVMAHVCPECWGLWETQQTIVINEYQINLGDPAARAKLYEIMEDFLNIKEYCKDL